MAAAAVASPIPNIINNPLPSIIRPSSSNSNRASNAGEGPSRANSVTSIRIQEPTPVDEKHEIKLEDPSKSPSQSKRKLSAGDSVPQRPPIRPQPSKFELEPNPFEQSFSKGSNHSVSSASDHNTPPRGGDATSIKHNALPPLSSLTSPAAADPSQFPWLAGGSLRTGPLRPAMLAGPQHHNNGHSGLRQHNGEPDHQVGGAFESNTFRTGFTPGTGSGFTPGYSSLMNGNFASSLPLPSPNTAAFLNNFTNSTPIEGSEGNQGSHHPDPSHPPSAIPPHLQHHGLSHLQHETPQDTITPNTLSALTGVYNDMHRNHSSGPPPQHGSYYNPNIPPGPQHHHPHGPPHPGAPHVDYAQQSANAASQAANGLFLLSQAHQELSKREETEPLSLSGDPRNSGSIPPLSAVSGGKRGTSTQRTPVSAVSVQGGGGGGAGGGTKRKSDTVAGVGKPAGKRGRKSGGGATGGNGAMTINMAMGMGGAGSPRVVKGEQSTSPQFSDDEDGMVTMEGMEGETEEDKRKNFLERNRQAALKCRQRKKAWLNELQTKVEGLQMENERLQQTIAGLHDEVGRLSGMLMQHRDCGLVGGQYGRPIR